MTLRLELTIFAIERLFKSNAKSASLYIKNAGDTISNWHSSLAKDIDKVAKELGCERIGKAYSYNLLGRANKNTAWKKN